MFCLIQLSGVLRSYPGEYVGVVGLPRLGSNPQQLSRDDDTDSGGYLAPAAVIWRSSFLSSEISSR